MRKRLLAVVTAFMAIAPGSWRRSAEFIPLGMLKPEDTWSFPDDLSADGSTVVGISGNEAFVWTRQRGMVGLGFLPGQTTSDAMTVSADGSVIFGASGGFPWQPVRWSADGAIEAIGGTGVAGGTSANGEVVVGNLWDNGAEPFRWTKKTGFQALGTGSGSAEDVSADGTVIVGEVERDGRSQAFRWTEDDGYQLLGYLPGSPHYGGIAWAISADGKTIVGGTTDSRGESTVPFRWTELGGMDQLGSLGQTSVATAVSADGSVIVGSAWVGTSFEDQEQRAFVWDMAGGIRFLDDWLRADGGLQSQLDGWHLTRATAISDDGQYVTSEALNPQGNREAVLIRLPEPSTAFLLSLGSLLIAVSALRPPRVASACSIVCERVPL